jgi:hypothetical protein
MASVEEANTVVDPSIEVVTVVALFCAHAALGGEGGGVLTGISGSI